MSDLLEGVLYFITPAEPGKAPCSFSAGLHPRHRRKKAKPHPANLRFSGGAQKTHTSRNQGKMPRSGGKTCRRDFQLLRKKKKLKLKAQFPIKFGKLIVEGLFSPLRHLKTYLSTLARTAPRKKRNRVGGCPLFGQPSSHTTVRAVRHTAVQ